MIATPVFIRLGNICVAIAALIFVLPLQKLLWDYSHKKRHTAGGETTALFVVIPLWLFLLGALLCATANGGFDVLRLDRWALYVLTVAATVALGVVSFACVAVFLRPGFLPRIVLGPPIYVIPLTTILLAALLLNPQRAPGVAPQLVRLPWIIAAALSLVACVGYLGNRLVTAGGSQMRRLAHTFDSNRALTRTNLASVLELDPTRDFSELVRLADESQGDEVRDAALARLRRNPDFVACLVTELTSRTLSNGELDSALAVLDFATFTPEEQKLLALPARKAMTRTTKYMQSQFRYFLKDKRRRKAAHRWGNRLFTSIAAKFAGAGVDFQPALDAFEESFTSPGADNR